jgi:hypothetical protein
MLGTEVCPYFRDLAFLEVKIITPSPSAIVIAILHAARAA